MVKNLLIALVVLLALLVVVVVTRPDSFKVERSATVAAPPAVAYGLVADFHQWEGWSPWAKLDPKMKTTYTGSGVGGAYAWEGDDKVGSGKMTFADLKPGELVAITLEFIKPFPSTNHTEFRFAPDGAGTKVTWSMEGKHNFMSKAMGLVMNMDDMIGKDFEKGLGQLKPLAEAAAAKAADDARAAAEAAAPEAKGAEPAPAPSK